MTFIKPVQKFAMAGLCALGAAGAQAAILNGGFEFPTAGSALTGWTDTDSVYGFNRCSMASCNGFNGAASGNYWIWFGGNSLDQVARLSQSAVIESNFGLLLFDLWAAGISGTGKLTLTVDSTTLFTLTETDALAYAAGYFTVAIPLGTFADSGQHLISFDYVDALDSSNNGTSYFLDNVRLIAPFTVPEPGSLTLVALAGLALLARRRAGR